MSHGPLVTLAHFTYPFEAHLFRGLLESRNVTAFIMDEHLITLQWMWEIALGGVKVQVPPHDLDAARAVLADYQAHRLATPTLTPDDSTPQKTTRFYGWRVLVTVCWATTVRGRGQAGTAQARLIKLLVSANQR